MTFVSARAVSTESGLGNFRSARRRTAKRMRTTDLEWWYDPNIWPDEPEEFTTLRVGSKVYIDGKHVGYVTKLEPSGGVPQWQASKHFVLNPDSVLTFEGDNRVAAANDN